MQSTVVTISPEVGQTRVLMVSEGRDVLKAVLPAASGAHRTAATALLEALALWYQQRLSVVLCVDEQPDSCDALGLCDALGYGIAQLHFDVGVAHRNRARRNGRRLTGVGDFRDLRQLHLEVL